MGRSTIDEQALVELLLERKEEGFRQLMRYYKDDLVNFAYRIVGSYDDAVDVAQETFIRVYRFIETFQRGARLRTWLFAIARNVALTMLDERRRHRTHPLVETDEEGEEKERDIPDVTYVPDRAVDSTIIAQRIQEALMKLPAVFREAVILRDIEGLTYEEIAEVCAVELGTVKSRINRGRTMLQELLRDLFEELYGKQQ
ncbi:MAG: RNA polymerase sigma24 factor [Candidatus Kapaibacterium sp.]|nr:MAG: RNA polymerase sigma24 factor [Candidatus Kapabacteria bacterium]